MRDLSILYGSLKTGFYSVFIVLFKRAGTVETAVFDVQVGGTSFEPNGTVPDAADPKERTDD